MNEKERKRFIELLRQTRYFSKDPPPQTPEEEEAFIMEGIRFDAFNCFAIYDVPELQLYLADTITHTNGLFALFFYLKEHPENCQIDPNDILERALTAASCAASWVTNKYFYGIAEQAIDTILHPRAAQLWCSVFPSDRVILSQRICSEEENDER